MRHYIPSVLLYTNYPIKNKPLTGRQRLIKVSRKYSNI
nr:MAG TPA: hypothetical protein [Caudoviricetes sp.]